MRSADMEIRLLGPVELHVQGRRIDLGPRRQRFLLAVLALEVNTVVITDRLVDLVWPVDPPRTAVHALHVSVSRLRSIVAQPAGQSGLEALRN
jgi:ABC-2 type transport system ATP-binding protein